MRRGVNDFLPLEDLIAAHLAELFPGMDVMEHQVFRVTRNADLEVEEDRDEDLLQALERELARRRFGPPVRLEITDTTSERVLALLLTELDVDPADAVEVPGLLDLSSLWQLYGLDRPALKDPPFVPATNPAFAEGETPKSVFATLRDGDVLLHHPYESFATTVQRFIEQAAADPRVLAIKQTLYRTSGDSPIVDALISAAAAGKQVVALVEIKARFDEQANISWAKALERAGVHVVYGLVGLKTHCKTALVIRQEGKTLRRYCHLGTGNYNPKTARIYEDLGLLTADPDIGADLTDLFNVLTGYSRQTEYRNLLVAPHSIRSGIVARIEREIEHQRAGRGGLVRLKMNSIVDEGVIDALYRASRAGVTVDVTVRGICALRAGVPGLSENITVRSIVGRFLEHSRIFYFRNGGGASAAENGGRRRRRHGKPRGVLDRQRGHDAPQPRSPGRGAGPGQGQGRHRPDGRAVRDHHRARHPLLGTGSGRLVEIAGRRPRQGHPGRVAQAGRRAWRMTRPATVIRAAGAVLWRPPGATACASRWCTAPGTTTGRCPRARPNRARCRRSPRPARWRRRPGFGRPSAAP